MANSGLKKVTQLRKYINGRPTDEVKENTVDTEGYIPDVVSNEECPVGCDSVVEGLVLVQGTTTTTTTTTIAVTPDPILGRNYLITNLDTQNTSTVRYTDEYGATQDQILQPSQEETLFSRTQPTRVSGGQALVEPTGVLIEGTTTTTTKPVVQSTDYTIDTSSATENTVVSLTQFNTSTPIETEIPPGKIVKLTSDTEPSVVSGDQSTTVTNSGAVTPEEDTYTVTNNDFYNSTIVEYRPLGGVTDEVELSPRETRDIKSQDTPTVSSGATNVTVTAAGTPTQDADLALIPKRICNQHFITNDSDYIATFEYRDCDLIDREVTLEPGEEVSVPSVITPVLTAETAPNVGTAYSATEVTKDYGTSGTATNVQQVTTSSTTTTTTKAIVQETLLVPDNSAGTLMDLTDVGSATDLTSRWYPKEVTFAVSRKTGTFKFISYDDGSSGKLYKVYEGSNLLLDTMILSDRNNGRFQSETYGAMISNGETTTTANLYSFGSKRTEPTKLGKEKVFLGQRQLYNPFGTVYHTEFTLNKTTFTDVITVEIYQPYHAGEAGTSAVSYVARFEVKDIT